jgi:AhpD family alkylhydroperoxidase
MRLNPATAAPGALQPMFDLEASIQRSSLESGLMHLVKTRASQINGCAFCIDMHTRHALAQGEGADRLLLLDAWREAPCYTPRERAALAWTDALTRVAETRAPDEDYAVLSGHFTEEEQVQLTLLIGAINAWNRLAIGFRAVPTLGVGNARAA